MPADPQQLCFVVRWTDAAGIRQQTERTTRDLAYKLAATLPKSEVVHVGMKEPVNVW